ncbi:alpha/beta-hydrolase [Bimuria novae-zelandiae CBS 107.79]|uniref:Alpha/beta-hydrolase n=1 Tax=Bimuria novae-zelandiae CBS 107.79 TaxID=1447943 RepID=A0A6A5V6X4_9PLEO|nr:alpha/beta-hydrolase [Bimuria novae-zelandiae CBS 107.79]
MHLFFEVRVLPARSEMYYYNLVVTFASSLIGLPTVRAGVPHTSTLGSVAVLSDNDLAGNLTIQTTNALLLSPSTYSVAVRRCASLHEGLWSPSHSNFSLGLKNALSYQAYLNPSNSLHYWISSSVEHNNLCTAVTTNGILVHRSCNTHLPALCTNAGPLSSAGESDTRPALQITVQSGTQSITGFRDFYTWQFRGIRFASQPERFTFSTLYEGSGEVDATTYGPGCLQGPDARWPELSEDCLFLNVWTPYLPSTLSSKRKLKAVMVWLYGGGNTAGTGTDPEKEGGNLASRGDVVVVTFNYRVGNLGFLAFDDGVHNGNYAISDMLTALRWVQKNIENFGGDPNRVTVWGESAGANNIRTLLAIPEAEKEGLFHGTIMQSMSGEIGAQGAYVLWDTPAKAYERFTKKVLAETNCSTASDELSCLRSYDALQWSASGRTQANLPTRDNILLSTRALPLSGPLAHAHNIPVMLGVNRDELSYYFATPTTNFTANLQSISALTSLPLTHLANSSFSPEKLPSWPSLTQAEKEAAVFNASSKVATNLIFTCPTHAFAYSATKNYIFTAAYEFVFNRTYQTPRFGSAARPICGRDVDTPDSTEYYKCHAGEVPYTFGNILQQGWPDRDGTDTAFARLVVDYWAAFARTGKPAAEEGFLAARGFGGSEEKMRELGTWSGDGEVVRLQWSGLGEEREEVDEVGCGEMGLGRVFYEGFEYGGDEEG